MAGDRARYDDNQVTTLIAVSNADSLTPVLLEADPVTHALIVQATISTAGLATAAKQDTGNTSLASIDSKTPALGQALAAASVPVVLTAAQLTTLTPPAAITNYANETGGNLAIIAGAISSSVAQTNLKQVNGVTTQTGTGTAGTGSQRVAVASDSSIVLATGANTIGALTANQSVNVAQMNGVTVTMNNGAVGTGVQRVTLASDSTGQVKLAASSGTDIGALTANQSVNLAQLAGNTLSSGVGASGTGTLRVVEANDVGRTLKSAGGSAASNGNNTLVAAGTNKLKVFAFSLSTTITTAMTCIFQSGAGGTELWRVILQAPTSISTGANLSVAVPGYLFSTAAATLLNLNLSSANAVHWSVSYFDEV